MHQNAFRSLAPRGPDTHLIILLLFFLPSVGVIIILCSLDFRLRARYDCNRVSVA